MLMRARLCMCIYMRLGDYMCMRQSPALIKTGDNDGKSGKDAIEPDQ